MNVVIGAKTDPGRRPNNEDQLAVVDVRRHGLRADSVLVIADGMGGRNSGEKASAAAVEAVQDTLVEMLSERRTESVDTGDALASALRKANARVYELGRRQNEQGQGGMGTTCVAAVLLGETLSVAHAGDSRAYLLRDGKLERLTDDHSYVAEQVRAGAITEESARRSRFRNVITRAVGIEPTITPDVSEYEVALGDNILLCTDGLTNMVPEDQIAQTLQYAPTPQAAADRLIQLANRNGGKDNITAVVARLEVSNRTQRLRPQDLPHPQAVPQTHPAPVDDRVPARNGKTEPQAPQARRPARAPLWPVLSSVIIFALLGVIGYLVHRLRHAGDGAKTVQSRPAPPAPLNLSSVHYTPPQLFYVKPVQGGLLALNDADGTLTVVTQSSQVVRLAHDGTTLFHFPLPDSRAAASVLPGVPSEGDHHFAVDTQGNLYDADAAAGFIYKYQPNGDIVGQITDAKNRPFQGLASLAVAADGTVYVIDAERLKVLHPIAPQVPPPAAPPTPPRPGSGAHGLVPNGSAVHPHAGTVPPKPHGSTSPARPTPGVSAP